MFNVTYDIVTPESAENGESDSHGFIAKNLDLRAALDVVFETRTAHCDGVTCIEANEWPMSAPRWVTVYNGGEFLTGAHESRSVHFPDHLSAATRCRIARLMGVP